jgi:hypothetical protein
VPRDQVFISYSHTDRQWLESLQTMLKPLVRKNSLSVWDDTTIKAGAKWKEEIERALGKAKVAVLIVTHNFLNSDFIAEHELPPLLDAAAKEGLIILWIYASSCLFDETEIRDYQAAHDISKPLDSLTPAKRSVVLVEVCKPIKAAVNVVDPSPEAEPRGVGQEVHANVASQNTRRLITNIEFTLERPFAEFDEEKFKNALKLATGIDASQIRIASIRSGSTIVNMMSAGISKVVRAGGALAAFAAIYFLNPASLAILHRRLECLLRSYLKIGAWLNTFGNKRT